MDHTVHRILQARILEWVAFPFFRGSSQPGDQAQVSHIEERLFTSWAIREAQEYWSGQPMLSPRASRPRNWTGISCIAGGLFSSWATREAQFTKWTCINDVLWTPTLPFVYRSDNWSPQATNRISSTQRCRYLMGRKHWYWR